MDKQVIAAAFKKTKRSKSGLAKVLGIEPSGVSALLKGERLLKAHEIPKVREYLRLDSVPLKGYVGAGSQAQFFELPEDEMDRVPAREDATASTVAVEIRGDSMGVGLNGWIAYYDDVQRPARRDLHKKLCVVGLPDGRVLIKYVVPSKVKGLYHLQSNAGGETIHDVPIEWAAKVIGMQPR